jgi:uncharacterized protein (UPF0212 family)
MSGDGHIDLEEYGVPGCRDCPTCGEPLEPGFIDESIALAWLCPNHGMITFMPNPVDED